MKDYRKSIVAVSVVVVTALHAALSDGTLTLGLAPEWVSVIVAAFGAVLVWLVRNGDKPEEK